MPRRLELFDLPEHVAQYLEDEVARGRFASIEAVVTAGVAALESAHVARQSDERFSRIFEHSPIPITLNRVADGIIIDANQSFLRFAGFTREEVIGKSPLDLGIYPDPSQRAVLLETLRRQGCLRGYAQRFRTKSGDIRDNVLWLDFITIGGEKCMLVMCLDVTEQNQAGRQQKRLEEQLRQAQKLEALGTLAGGIAHDFNNILGAIISFTELSKFENSDNHDLQENLTQVLKASERAVSLVRQILTFSRLDKRERTPLQLSCSVQEVLTLLRATLPSTISIEQTFDVGVPEVMANATQMHQVIMNLCTNAAYAMKGQHGKLIVRLDSVVMDAADIAPQTSLRPGHYVRLRVIDTGFGMDEATVKRVFDPFFTTKPLGEGTGLGLSVTHGIVKEHEGVIAVESLPAIGTTFSMYLPACPSTGQIDLDNQLEPSFGRGERVLFVDDEAMLGVAAHRMLQRLRYEPIVFNSPEAAWLAFAANPSVFDAVITDMTMPVVTGLELAQRIVALRPALPIILASGSSEGMSAATLQRLGISELVTKPLDYQTLAGALKRALRHGR